MTSTQLTTYDEEVSPTAHTHSHSDHTHFHSIRSSAARSVTSGGSPSMDAVYPHHTLEQPDLAMTRARLRRYFAYYQPNFTDADINPMLAKYGQSYDTLEVMWQGLKKKYGREPIDNDSYHECIPCAKARLQAEGRKEIPGKVGTGVLGPKLRKRAFENDELQPVAPKTPPDLPMPADEATAEAEALGLDVDEGGDADYSGNVDLESEQIKTNAGDKARKNLASVWAKPGKVYGEGFAPGDLTYSVGHVVNDGAMNAITDLSKLRFGFRRLLQQDGLTQQLIDEGLKYRSAAEFDKARLREALNEAGEMIMAPSAANGGESQGSELSLKTQRLLYQLQQEKAEAEEAARKAENARRIAHGQAPLPPPPQPKQTGLSPEEVAKAVQEASEKAAADARQEVLAKGGSVEAANKAADKAAEEAAATVESSEGGAAPSAGRPFRAVGGSASNLKYNPQTGGKTLNKSNADVKELLDALNALQVENTALAAELEDSVVSNKIASEALALQTVKDREVGYLKEMVNVMYGGDINFTDKWDVQSAISSYCEGSALLAKQSSEQSLKSAAAKFKSAAELLGKDGLGKEETASGKYKEAATLAGAKLKEADSSATAVKISKKEPESVTQIFQNRAKRVTGDREQAAVDEEEKAEQDERIAAAAKAMGGSRRRSVIQGADPGEEAAAASANARHMATQPEAANEIQNEAFQEQLAKGQALQKELEAGGKTTAAQVVALSNENLVLAAQVGEARRLQHEAEAKYDDMAAEISKMAGTGSGLGAKSFAEGSKALHGELARMREQLRRQTQVAEQANKALTDLRSKRGGGGGGGPSTGLSLGESSDLAHRATTHALSLLAAKTAEVKELRNLLQKQQEVLRAREKEMTTQIEALKADNDGLTAETKTAAGRAEAATGARYTLEAQISSLNGRYSQLSSDYSYAQEKTNGLEATEQSLREQLTQLRMQVARLSSDKDELQRATANAQSEATTLREELAELRVDYANVNQESVKESVSRFNGTLHASPSSTMQSSVPRRGSNSSAMASSVSPSVPSEASSSTVKSKRK